jgi:Protein of unknown function (DUF1194)
LDYGAGDPRVLNAIHGRPGGSIGICFIEWSGEEEQRVVVDWTAIRDEEDAGVVAASILAAPRSFTGRTSISWGVDFAVVQFARSKWQVERRIIDIFGDGTDNSGRSVTQARDQAVSHRADHQRAGDHPTTAPIWDIPGTATRPVVWRIIIDRT